LPVNVFVSYRRQDTPDFTGRLVEKLRHSPGIGAVFMDVESLEPSADFALAIEHHLERSEVCIVVIGPNWVGAAEGGPTRIHDAGDWVRLEIAVALARRMRIVPVLAHEATFPLERDLPVDIRGLAHVNGVRFRHDSFDRDVDYLLDVLMNRKSRRRVPAYLTRHPKQASVLRAFAGLVGAAIVLLIAAVVQHAFTGKALDQVLGGRGPVALVILLVLAAGTVAPFVRGQIGPNRAGQR
jgi:hypothetical protein